MTAALVRLDGGENVETGAETPRIRRSAGRRDMKTTTKADCGRHRPQIATKSDLP